MGLSPLSITRLNTCDERLRRLVTRIASQRDCVVLEGHRTLERQHELFLTGKSKVRRGKHNESPSLAVDVAPLPLDWDDKVRFVVFGQLVVSTAKDMGIPIRWGGDWDGDGDRSDQTFDDLVHFEVR